MMLILTACGVAPTAPTPAPASATPTPLPLATLIPAEPTVTPSPSPSPTPVPVFTLAASNPVLPHGTAPLWDTTYIDPGAMVFHDGKFHMFFNGIDGFPRPIGVGYATSTDGVTWTRVGDKPVFSASELNQTNGPNLFVSSALVMDDGTWVLYYYTISGGNFISRQSIGRMTAPSPMGPWKADAKPVLEPGSAGAWDSHQVSGPNVLKTKTGYVLYYDGMSSSGSPSLIGMAASSDGVHWQKHKDANVAGDQFLESTPVLFVGEPDAWDAKRVLDPNVVQTPDGWEMAYLSTSAANKFGVGNFELGYATSADGIHWTRAKANPIITSKVTNWSGIFLVKLLNHADTFFLYFDVATGKGTNIYLAEHKGALGK